MLHFCTYFDRNFVSRAFVLLDSLKRHAGEFVLYALCLDSDAYRVIQGLNDPQCQPLALLDVEAAYPSLHAARSNRNKIEYYFTLSPFLPLYILRTLPHVPWVAYVDADCCFYGPPEPIYRELAEGSILVTEHGFPAERQHLLRYGRFNVGLLAFRNDETGRACLERWATQCAEWCYDRLEDGKYGDQKYLDEWPTRYSGVRILDQRSVNLAPWNLASSTVSCHAGRLYVEDAPLLMYHFHGLRLMRGGLFRPTSHARDVLPEHIKHLYLPYVRALLAAERRIGGESRTGRDRDRLRSASTTASGIHDGQWTVARPAWLADVLWRRAMARRARDAALSTIVDTYRAGARRECLANLSNGIVRHPLLLLNTHVWNVLLHGAVPSRQP